MPKVFKGNIKAGTISAKFLSDFSNVDPDLLIASYAEASGTNPQTAHEAIAPGGAASVSITATKKGLLDVMVVTGHEEESGRLQVSRNGTIANDEAIKGPMEWVYTVIE